MTMFYSLLSPLKRDYVSVLKFCSHTFTDLGLIMGVWIENSHWFDTTWKHVIEAWCHIKKKKKKQNKRSRFKSKNGNILLVHECGKWSLPKKLSCSHFVASQRLYERNRSTTRWLFFQRVRREDAYHSHVSLVSMKLEPLSGAFA